MAKVIELIVVFTLLVFAFFAGVKYSDSIKERAGWLFESKEEEVELPDLSSEGAIDGIAPVDDGGVNLDNPANFAPQDSAPMDNMDGAENSNQVVPAPAQQAMPTTATAPVAMPTTAVAPVVKPTEAAPKSPKSPKVR